MELEAYYPYIETYKIPAIFIGSFLFGETIILSAVFFSIENSWPLSTVFLFSFLGTLSADILWFVFGQRFLHKLLYFFPSIKERYSRYLHASQTQTPLKQAYYLLFFKFLYGTRIVTILYVALQKMSLRTFLVFDSLGTLIWLSTIILVGKLAWQGTSLALEALHISQYTLGAAFFLVVIFKLMTLWLEKQNEQ